MQKIQTKQKEALSKSQEKLKNVSSSFQEAATQLARYSDEKKVIGSIKSKKASSVNAEERFSFSENNRKALKDYYEEFLNLDDQKEELIKELNNAKNISTPPRRSRRSINNVDSNSSNRSAVLESLKVINWDSKEINWERLYNQWKGRAWNKENIFFPLLESEKVWNEWLQLVRNAENELEAYRSSWGKRMCGLSMVLPKSVCYPELDKLNEKIKKAKRSLELQIGKMLMKEMKRVI